MSFSFIAMMMLVGSSVVIAFVLQPHNEEPAASANSPVSHHRCQHESLESIRKGLLSSLNLQVEPQLPAGALDAIRQRWRSTFRSVADKASDAAVPVASSYSGSCDGGNNTQCCPVASEIFMSDLGWDSWVVHPTSLTIIHCALCNLEGNPVQCPASHSNMEDPDSQGQVPCCQPTSQKMVPVVYMDESSTLTISSVDLTNSCGRGHAKVDRSNKE